jgi:stearoyl-CoA desaturase (delta-9 desaturase)
MLEFLNTHLYGLASLSILGYVGVTLLWMHTTMMAITLYFHRDQAHRAVDLHPAVRHFCRFWLWLNTGAPTKQWVAVHRKHHAFCEQEGDPHSPVIFGLKRVVLEGAELYMQEARNPETLEKYGKGTPDDWLERNVYSRFDYTGIVLLVVFNIVMFGAPGIIMIALELATMPAFAAGIINGVCHAKGYRNFETNDASTNLWRIGLFVAGEELHNNHHAFPTSARFSMRADELDMGWLHLKVLAWLGLARIKRVAALQPELVTEARNPDLDSLRAVIIHRMHVLRHYTNNVTLPELRRELEHLGENANSVVAAARRLLAWEPHLLDAASRARLAELVDRHPGLKTALQYRNGLKNLWEGAHQSNERLLAEFCQWCAEAEASGIQCLEDFVAYLKSFRAIPEPASG